jgi:SAM-dependent methyltransferase
MKCVDCSKRQGLVCTAHEVARGSLGREFPPHPFSACVIPIVEQYCDLIQPGQAVLEIGCGTWSAIRDRCLMVGAHYEAIDIAESYYGLPTVATRIENLAALSFEDDRFDLVFGNQTLEHWGEYGCRTEWGLQQCFRVAKPRGLVALNVPIHFHGVSPFFDGDIARIRQIFAAFSDRVELTEWGREHDPLEPYFAHPGYPALAQQNAWILDIRATKTGPAKRRFSNAFAASGKAAQVLSFPLSWTVHRLLVRAGLRKAQRAP